MPAVTEAFVTAASPVSPEIGVGPVAVSVQSVFSAVPLSPLLTCLTRVNVAGQAISVKMFWNNCPRSASLVTCAKLSGVGFASDVIRAMSTPLVPVPPVPTAIEYTASADARKSVMFWAVGLSWLKLSGGGVELGLGLPSDRMMITCVTGRPLRVASWCAVKSATPAAIPWRSGVSPFPVRALIAFLTVVASDVPSARLVPAEPLPKDDRPT